METKHYSDCKVNGYDTPDKGIIYAPETECDCGGYSEKELTQNKQG